MLSTPSLRRASLLGLGAACLLSVSSPAEATTANAKEAASKVFQRFQELGLSVNANYQLGLLPLRGEEIFDTQLYKGKQYVLVGAGCSDARDVDLLIYDEQGRLLARDTEHDPVPVLQFEAPYTGTYYMRVVMYDSTPDGAHWVMQTGYL